MKHSHQVIIVGAGQAALATAYFLRRHHIEVLILDRQERPGGAWLHTWESLQLFSPAQWSSLPGWPLQCAQTYPTRLDVINYLAAYEKRYGFDVARPVNVVSTQRLDNGFELVASNGDVYRSTVLISATGNWSNPYTPTHFNIERFKGVQLHSANYKTPVHFQGQKVLVVGGGNSAAQILAELSKVAQTTWVTLSPPTFLPDDVDGRALFERATLRWRAQQEGKSIEHLPGGFGDVVMIDAVKDARARGVLHARRSFQSLTEQGVQWADESEEHFDAVIWCTGFQPSLQHLSELDLLDESGRVACADTRSLKRPGLWLVGYGDWCGFASATLIGVQRYAKSTAAEVAAYLV